MHHQAETLYLSLKEQWQDAVLHRQSTVDNILTLWVDVHCLTDMLSHLKLTLPQPFLVLYDLSAIDERQRIFRQGQPASDFTLVYHLISYDRNMDLRLKVPLQLNHLSVPSITPLWPSANWYESEVWDMFGIRFENHPNLRRILTPPTWQGHPLRKDHYARATEQPAFSQDQAQVDAEQQALKFDPKFWGMKKSAADSDFMFLNLGPNHPSVHGVFRIALQLSGEEIIDAIPDIGYHHRGAEKMAERQSWHSYIPYTDRIDYLGGVMNNLPYVLAVEKLAGIRVPDRVKTIRVMMCELFRIASHLVFYGTFAQDVGQLSPIFYMFIDREKLFGIIEAFTGARMHPSWFRIGGIASDLPQGWDRMIREFVDYMPARLDQYDKMVMNNSILKNRTVGVGDYTTAEAIEWGITGPGLRATGCDWDWRKQRPYSGYDQFEFEVPTGHRGDCYDRCQVRVEEMRQSLRIIRQCLDNMPEGPIKADHPLTTPPPKERSLKDIDTLISHFVSMSWGPRIPVGEASIGVEGTKGNNSYYLVSDGDTRSYRTRIRTPSFPHLQMIPLISRGLMVSDLIAIIASIDFVMADVDR